MIIDQAGTITGLLFSFSLKPPILTGVSPPSPSLVFSPPAPLVLAGSFSPAVLGKLSATFDTLPSALVDLLTLPIPLAFAPECALNAEGAAEEFASELLDILLDGRDPIPILTRGVFSSVGDVAEAFDKCWEPSPEIDARALKLPRSDIDAFEFVPVDSVLESRACFVRMAGGGPMEPIPPARMLDARRLATTTGVSSAVESESLRPFESVVNAGAGAGVALAVSFAVSFSSLSTAPDTDEESVVEVVVEGWRGVNTDDSRRSGAVARIVRCDAAGVVPAVPRTPSRRLSYNQTSSAQQSHKMKEGGKRGGIGAGNARR